MNRIIQIFGRAPVLLPVVHPMGRAEALEVAFANLSTVASRAAPYMDVICTSGPGTGQAADADKLRAMHEHLGDTALALASGVTAANVHAYVPYVDAFLVGTRIEARFGVIDERKLTELLRALS